MGKRQLLTLLFVLGITLPIQLQAQVKEKGFFVEGSFAYADEHNQRGYENYFIIKPTIGYQFNSKWSLGFKMDIQCGVEVKSQQYLGYTPFVRYNFCHIGNVYLFGEGKFSAFKRRENLVGVGIANGYKEAGISLGAYLPLNNHLKVVCQYLHIGYSEQELKSGAFIHSGDWGIDANIKRLQLGLNWTF